MIWIIAIILLLTSTVTYGAYTYFQYAKRVVSTQSPGGISFSSNLLDCINKGITDCSKSFFSFQSDEDSVKVLKKTITVCNFAQNDRNNYNENNIHYTFYAGISDPDNVLNGNYNGFSVKYNSSDTVNFNENGKVIIDELCLSTGSSVTDNFIITAPKENLESISILIKAVPVTADYIYTNDYYLAKEYRFINSASNAILWSGDFTDKFALKNTLANSSEADTKKYNGFNYEISGNGKGMVTLSWNTDFVEIDPDFVSSLNVQPVNDENSSIKKISFSVGEIITVNEDEYETINIYQIQFYRTDPAPANEVYDRRNATVMSGDIPYVVCQFTDESD